MTGSGFKLKLRIASVVVFALVAVSVEVIRAETGRWRGWEFDRNELVANRTEFQPLPKAEELEELQTKYIYKVTLPRSAVKVLTNSQAGDLLSEFVDPKTGQVSFYIHPAAIALFAHLIKGHTLEKVPVDPTTSPRTFFYLDGFNLKLSLQQEVNGAIRTVYPIQIERALAVSELLGEIPRDAQGAEHFGFLPESIGVYDATEGAPFGFLVRVIPREIVEGKTTLAPLTAYCSRGKKGEPTLLELDARATGLSPAAHVEQNVLPALLEAFTVAAEHGIVLQAHQQNTLLELDEHGRFTGRIFFRDMDGGRVDFELRAKKGLSTRHLKSVSNPEWVFELEGTAELNRNLMLTQERPSWWTGLVEKGYQAYIMDSSVFLLQHTLARVDATGMRTPLNQLAAREMRRITRSHSQSGQCRALFF